MPNPAHKCSTCGKCILVKTRGMAFLDFLGGAGEGKEVGGNNEGGQGRNLCVCIHLKKKTPHTNQHHPHQPIAHPSLFSKTKQLAACRANSQVPRDEFFLHLWQQASIFVIALDSSNPDPPKGQNTSNPGISCDKISREIVRLENHGRDYCYLTGCESESSSSGRVVNAFHMP